MYLNPSQAYIDLLRSSHRVKVKVYILDNSRRYMADATGSLISGTVDMDATGSVTRSGSVSLLDPGNRLSLDLNAGQSGPEFYNRMIQVVYNVSDFRSGVSFEVPLFTGPVTNVQRDGVILNVDFKGLEILLQNPILRDYTWPAGMTRSQVIMNAAAITSGEVNFRDLSGGTQYLRSSWSVASGDNLWEQMKAMADAMACLLFYDGNGVLNIKPKTSYPVFTIDTSFLTEDPEVSFDIENVKNVCRVEGASLPQANGEKVAISFEGWAPPQHPFSPQSLARNGVPRIVARLISDTSITDFRTLQEIAWATMSADIQYATETTAVTSVIPFLEEYDIITVSHPRVQMTSPVTKWTIPLVGDAEMSLNFFSTSSKGNVTRTNFVSNAGLWGRMNMPGMHHGPGGAFNTLSNGGKGLKGLKEYDYSEGGSGAPGPNKGKKGKKGNRNRGGGKKGKNR